MMMHGFANFKFAYPSIAGDEGALVRKWGYVTNYHYEH
jgi:hypothetical protein